MLCQSTGIAYAEPFPHAGTSQYAFGRHLFALGEYYRAVTELKRFSLLFPQHPHYPAAQVLIGLAFQEDGEHERAWAHFQQVRDTVDDAAQIAAFKLGELRVTQRQYPQAIQHFQYFLRTFPDDPLAGRATYLLGLSWALHDRVELAQQALQLVPPDHPLAVQARALSQELDIPRPPPPKSPMVAGILAGVLPGAGHLYIGKPWHGLTAFLLNGLFLSGAVFAFLEGLEVTAVILLYFETGWYLGNIKSAVGGARAVNQHQREGFADHLRATYAPSALTLHQLRAPGLGLRLRF
jgi:tetratricopeptide (TPR) repeat protein